MTDVLATVDFVIAAGDAGDGFAIGDVLFGEDPVGEGVRIVGFEDGNGALEDDGAVVEVFVDEVDGASGDFYAVIEGLLLSVETWEGGKQRRMDVEDAVGKGCDEGRREQAHVSSEADKVDVVLAEAGDEVGVVVGARAAFGDEDGGGEVEVFGRGDAGGVVDVGDRYRDFDPLELSGLDGIRDGEEVGTAAGEENS